MKPTSFEIPQGCTRVTIERHEDKLVTIFETPTKESFMDKVVSVSANCVGVEFKEYEPKIRFKDGDIIKVSTPERREYIGIKMGNEKISSYNRTYVFVSYDGELYIDSPIGYNDGDVVKFSPESLPIIQEALAKVGKKWNAEKKFIEELKPERWRAKLGNQYWFVDKYFKSDAHIERFDEIDNSLYEIGNYFQTEQQAKDFAERIKQLPR